MPRAFLNIAKGIPDELAYELNEKDAYLGVAKMPASQWTSCLRNALAHGGIAYLNEDGLQIHGEPVKIYAFLSGIFDEGDRKKLLGPNVLRVSESDFLEFLQEWVRWLEDSGISKKLAA